MSKILIALDGSPRAEQAIPHALAFRQPGDEILLVRVVEAVPPYPVLQPYQIQDLIEEADHTVGRYLKGLAKSIGEQGVEAGIRVGHGSPRQEIIRIAESVGARLIVMTSRGRTGVERFFLGSTAERVCRHSPIPVCLLPLDCLRSERKPRLESLLLPLDVFELSVQPLGPASQLPRPRLPGANARLPPHCGRSRAAMTPSNESRSSL